MKPKDFVPRGLFLTGLLTLVSACSSTPQNLDEALTTQARQRPEMQSILEARQAALNACARRFDRSREELIALDDSLLTTADHLVPAQSVRFRADYRGVEVLAVQESQVGEARGLIATARDHGADFAAPETLAQAREALRTAQTAILNHPRDEHRYAEPVAQARRYARWLTAVNAASREASTLTNEEIGRDVVAQHHMVRSLSNDLKTAELENTLQARALIVKQEELQTVAQRLESRREFERTMADVRRRFGRDEADVYRDGDRLLIRLKKMDFKTGSADLPAGSAPLLSKVKAVLREVKAKDVVVQGHADSTGPEKINQKVAAARATTVADYLEDSANLKSVSAVGMSDQRPIRSNETPDGRATNRRVDLVITPGR